MHSLFLLDMLVNDCDLCDSIYNATTCTWRNFLQKNINGASSMCQHDAASHRVIGEKYAYTAL